MSPEPGEHAGAGPFTQVALGWIVGTLLAAIGGSAWIWTMLAAAPLLVMLWFVFKGRDRAARCWGLVALVLIAAACCAGRTRYISEHDIRRFAGEQSQLAQLTGTVSGEPRLTTSRRGAFGAFDYRSPGTVFILDVETIEVRGETRRASGRVLVKIDQADHRVRPGSRVEVIGWLAAISGPVNPGEFDFRAAAARRGIYGRITLSTRGNWTLIDAPASGWWTKLRAAAARRAADSLRIGMQPDSRRVALLDALLLGRRGGDLEGLDESFRRVGLAHLLSISGAHLGILIWVVWMVVKLLIRQPPRAALVILAVLALYLLSVPARVPIIRAGIMAAIFCIGYATGRRMRPGELLSLACVVVLVWRPDDLFNSGFQLSFGVVAALLTFTGPLGQTIWPDPPVLPAADRTQHLIVRRAADYLAVNIVAYGVAMPLVMFHFQVITPLTILLSMMALPVVTVVLTLGYVKILAGLLLPSVGLMISGPLKWATDTLSGLVDHAATWPGATIELARSPSIMWTAAVLGGVIAWLGGAFVNRRRAMVGVIFVCVAAFMVRPGSAPPPPMRVNMFAVGNGSCYLVRLHDKSSQQTFTVMFDCGSQQYLHIGPASITPALKASGVRRIDVLIISHADLDHFAGALDVMDHTPVGKVLMTGQQLADAAERPDSASGFLVRSIRQRGLAIEAVSRGWSLAAGGGQLSVLWPPAGFQADRSNDMSMVLTVEGAGRRLLLSGDIQQRAIEGLLAVEPNIAADLCDLPHHGSFVEASPRWLKRVSPQIVLQSSGARRLRVDHWAPLMADTPIKRLITSRDGMVEVDVTDDGAMIVQRFKAAEP